ncbi:MAG: GNAT family N-acetyltransferase [Dehalococcoidia bacterium]
MSTTTIEMRPAEATDLARVQRLWEACGLAPAAADEWEALVAGPTTAVLLATDRDELLGSAIASSDGWRAYIYHVAVAPAHRGDGLGHRLMDQAEQYLLSAGARYVYVTVQQDNTEGLALAASQGYLPEGELVLVKRMATRVAQ